MMRYPSYKATDNEWLPEIPEEWDFVPIWTIASSNDEALSERTPPDTEINYIEISDVHPIKGIRRSTRMRFDTAPTRARRIVRHGDTIVSTVRTYLRAIAKVEKPMPGTIASTGFAVLRPQTVDPNYFSYAMRATFLIEQVIAWSKGVSYPAINTSELVRFKVPLPSSFEQMEASSYLTDALRQIDQLVFQQNMLISLLKEKRAALITSATSLGIRQAETKPSGLDYWGEVPEHWERHKLKRLLLSVDYGISETLGGEGNTPVLRMSNLDSGKLSYEDLKFSNEVPDDLLIRANDLLFNRTNSPDLVAQVALVETLPFERIGFASYLVRLRAKAEVHPGYLNYLLNSETILRFARRLAFGSINQSNLNPTRYGDLVLYIPGFAEQLEIVNFLNEQISAIAKITDEADRTSALLTERRKALISAVVSGAVDVSRDARELQVAA